ncbi:MAG: peptidase U32 family protein [Mangrovibacterium sp.]
MTSYFHAELLLPAGSVDSFRAAIRGGANAVYLGLKQFNARVRASNFGDDQLAAIMQEAHSHGVKVYVTLNTVIKNAELPQLLNFLATLDANKVAAIIIQDWGVYWLAKKHFPNLVLHASTQMANHNSIGVNHAASLGFARCVVARELTMPELESIAQSATCELEVFVHGALCYSFSGMCFFSSFIGGRGANRGLCSQACRMVYKNNGQKILPFNLKDNQQLQHIQKMQRLGIHSLKIEGRMKSAEYVHRVARAYRMVLDGGSMKEAERLLEHDFARVKTSYFLGNDLSAAIANDSNTGIYLGRVLTSSAKEICFESGESLQANDRLRIQKRKSKNTFNVKVENLLQQGNEVRISNNSKETISHGDQVFWIGRKKESFPSRLMKVQPIVRKLKPQQQTQILNSLKSKQQAKPETHLRIDNLQWLEFVRPEELSSLVLSLSKREWQSFDFNRKFIQKYIDKIALELPKFIAENSLSDWESIIDTAHQMGVRHFVVSHLSQKMLIPANCQITSNEQVYVFNDAAAQFISNEVDHFSYPIENDWQNLSTLTHNEGIFYIHTMPELFYSRMPIQIKEADFSDGFERTFHTCVKDGMTIVTPSQAVNFMQHRHKLEGAGIRRFMIDLKHQTPNPKLLKQLFINFKKGCALSQTSGFNFGKEMS